MKYSRAALAAAFAAMGILFAAIVNWLFTPGYLWFHDAAFALLWWPLAELLLPRRIVAFSLWGSAITIAFLAAVNLLNSPGHPWFLYALPPLMLWPIVLRMGRRAGALWFAALCGAVIILYYAALNLWLSPGHPWAIYPAFAILWWPMTLFFARRRRWFGYSVAGALWIIAFFIAVNAITSPAVIWAVFPAFAAAWWPLAMYWFRYRRGRLAQG